MTRAWRSGLLGLALLLAGAVVAQPGGRLAEVELGFRGAPVAEAWNPLRVTVRDVGSGNLTLVADQGSLREGELPWTMVFPIAGGAGVRVLEADVYLPAWRSLVWSLEAGGAIVASGALPRDAADRRRIDLVVSARPGAVAERVPGRVVDVPAAALPGRAAAYDGVRSVWVDGTAGVPTPAVLSAAASAGAVVVLAEAVLADAAYAGLFPADATWVAIGAGGWWRGEPPTGSQLEAHQVDLRAFVAGFAAAGGIEPPVALPVGALVVGASAYVLLLLLAWRAGGAPGVVTWLVLVAGSSLVASVAARPPAPTLVEARGLQVAAGDLAWRAQLHDVFTLPAAEVEVPRSARTATPVPGRLRLGSAPGTSLVLQRWRGATLVEPPRATAALLGLDADGLPVALGAVPLTDVRLVGGSGWRVVEPGRELGAASDPRTLNAAESAFEALLPRGAAWARVGVDWHVALPPEVRW